MKKLEIQELQAEGLSEKALKIYLEKGYSIYKDIAGHYVIKGFIDIDCMSIEGLNKLLEQ